MSKKRDTSIPDDAELLVELGSVDEVSAWIPTAVDHSEAITPDWCELVLEVQRTDDGTLNPAWPLNVRMPLKRHDGELIAQVLHDTLHPDRSPIALEALWGMLDDVVERIQKRVNKGRAPRLRDTGEAYGLAMAIAVMTNPMAYDVDEVRAVAMERYDTRHGISGVA